MKKERTGKHFQIVTHPTYLEPHDKIRLVQQSSAVGDYEDSWDNPGSSYLWVGDKHHLNREEVSKLIKYLNNWVKTGEL